VSADAPPYIPLLQLYVVLPALLSGHQGRYFNLIQVTNQAAAAGDVGWR